MDRQVIEPGLGAGDMAVVARADQRNLHARSCIDNGSLEKLTAMHRCNAHSERYFVTAQRKPR